MAQNAPAAHVRLAVGQKLAQPFLFCPIKAENYALQVRK